MELLHLKRCYILPPPSKSYSRVFYIFPLCQAHLGSFVSHLYHFWRPSVMLKVADYKGDLRNLDPYRIYIASGGRLWCWKLLITRETYECWSQIAVLFSKSTLLSYIRARLIQVSLLSLHWAISSCIYLSKKSLSLYYYPCWEHISEQELYKSHYYPCTESFPVAYTKDH